MYKSSKPSVVAAVGPGIPPTTQARYRLECAVDAYLERHPLAPPVPLDTLKQHAAAVLLELGEDSAFLPYTTVILNNTLWRPTVLCTPFAKRLLLIPQCLKSARHCPAECDTFGLLCRHCGRCIIDQLSRRAETLGYTVLIAEGSPVVTALIQSGQIEAVVGVSCLPVLEKVFPYMEAGAVPGIAIPLLYDGCKDTALDEDALGGILEIVTPAAQTVGLDRLRRSVSEWFTPEALKPFFGDSTDVTTQIAIDWLARGGKHYRPLLTAAMAAACRDTDAAALNATVQQAAVAVECFHKASLVHDDIEDDDRHRYGNSTLHIQHGVAVALNVGDLLIGQGYQLLAKLDAEPEPKNAMLAVAAQGHCALCLGQGQELACRTTHASPTQAQILDIFAGKTAPAFAVALKIGAILGGAEAALCHTLDRFAQALGVAYQIRDDLLDQQADQGRKELSIVDALGSAEAAQELRDEYRSRAIDCLDRVTSVRVKTLLRRVVARIFDEIETLECCDDFRSNPH